MHDVSTHGAATASGAAVAPPSHVTGDVVCLGCGYNLRGLAGDGVCPECAWPVARSMHGRLIRFADAAWSGRVARGVQCVYYSVLTCVLTFVLFVLVLVCGMAGAQADFWETVLTFVVSVFGLTMLALFVLYPMGWWLATTPDLSESDDHARDRAILRFTGLLLLPTLCAWRGAQVLLLRWNSWSGTTIDFAIETWTVLCFVVVWVHLLMMVRFQERTIERCAAQTTKDQLKNHKLLKATRRYVRGLPVVLLVIHGFTVALSISPFAASLNAWSGPWSGIGFGAGLGNFWMTMLWLSSSSALGRVKKAITAERLAANSHVKTPP